MTAAALERILSKNHNKVIVLTGATGGIGCALAFTYAQTANRLVLIARDKDRLERLQEELQDTYAQIDIKAIDVRNRSALHEYLAEIDAKHSVDILIANAGVTAGLGKNRSRERDEEIDRLIDVNYKGVVNTISGLLDRMQARKSGQIVLISSLAGMRALPDMPTYSATKAALIAYGDALRVWLKPFGISVTTICPGFVTSPMSARHKGPKPFEMSAQKAAQLMVKAVEKRRPFYAFPAILAAAIRLQNLLPTTLGDWFMRGFSAQIEDDPRYQQQEIEQ